MVLLTLAGCSDAGQSTDGAAGAAGNASAGNAGQMATAGGAGAPATAGGAGGVGGAQSTGGQTASAGAGSGGLTSSGGRGGNASSGGSPAVGGATAGGNGGGSGGATALDGKGLYDANCKACHGEQGVGGSLAPDIMHPVRDYSTWVIRNGRAQTTFPAPMTKWSTDQLSDAQLTLIFDFLDEPPQPTTGKALYVDYCANCHGADGKGGPTNRSLLNEVAKVLSQTRSGKNVGQFAMRRDYMPAFPTTAISDAELMLIRDYVDSL